MSRGFWAAIGAIVGFFVGGLVGHAIGTIRFHSVDDGGFTAIGTLVGLISGFAVTWFVAASTRPRDS
jgi:hypothetical protein